MEIARERFLDDSRRYHLTLSLRSRTTEMHSVLTGLSFTVIPRFVTWTIVDLRRRAPGSCSPDHDARD